LEIEPKSDFHEILIFVELRLTDNYINPMLLNSSRFVQFILTPFSDEILTKIHLKDKIMKGKSHKVIVK
jgi:hypothetical protein